MIVKKSAIESAVKVLSKVINPKNARPILDDILCEVTADTIRLTASDGDNTITTSVKLCEKADIDDRFCVAGKWLMKSLKNLTEQPVTIIVDEAHMKFRLQHQLGEMYMGIEDANEYPIPSTQLISATWNTELFLM